ncbi:AEC family transporter [Limnohabitans lacus]|uniref:AEC family transporter n=1 Tax=Limnohabitans lacus TaxID=3045173 RepID=A0ABT6X4M4_9BURK|nr:AEC family transporter [Limnohabitans sp. HM2-2]MDI9233070.1 AEC family transporter [Limnohabitans sp. HM2-2]
MYSKIASITLPIFTLVLVGFLYSRRVKPDLGGANKLVVDIALPVLIFISLSAKSFDPISALSFTGACVVLIFLSGLIAWPLAKFSGASRPAFLPCAMFTNVGPIGIPLIALAYGPEGMSAAVILLVISNILHFTLGAGVMTGKVDLRMVYANPLVWATVLGVASAQLQWALPDWIQTSCTMIGSVLVPMMLMSLGARLASSQVADARVGIQSAVLIQIIRLLAVFLTLYLVPLQGLERGALILFACLPSAVFNFMLADKFQVEPNKVASTVIVGHFLSLAFLPLGIWLAFI